MREELRHIDLIDKHLTGHLNDDEKSEVERLLAEDKEFAKELEVYKKIYTGIESKEDQKLRAKLDLLYAEYRASGEQKPKGLVTTLLAMTPPTWLMWTPFERSQWIVSF